jgi:hypothetical protein
MRLVGEGRKRYAILAAVFFVLTALSSWHLMVFTILVSALYLGYLVVVERWRYSQAMVLNLVLLAGLVFVVIAPFLYPLVREQLTVSHSYVGLEPSEGQGNDPVAFLLPAEQHPVLGKLVIPAPAHIKNSRAVYLGLTVIGLSIAGSLANWKRARFWVLVALWSMLFSLDPHIQIGGHIFGVTAPWSRPIIWLLRHPFRFNVLVGLALAVTSGLGLSAVLHQLADNRSRWRWPFVWAMIALLVFEYLCLPFPTTAAVVPAPYFDLTPSPGEGAVLELPMGRQPSKYYLYYQMVHGRPLVEGVVSRTSQEAYAFIEATPTLRSLRACGSYALPPAALSPVLNALREQGIAYVILHKRLVEQSSLDLWLDMNTVAPENEDEHVAVYSTQTESPRPSGVAQLLEACVAVRSLLTGPALTLQEEVLEIPLEWIIGNPPQGDYILELALVDETGETRRRHQYEVVPGASLTAWHMGKRHATSYPFYVDPVISPGTYRLQATLVPVQRDREALLTAHLLDIQVSAGSRDFSPPTRHKRVVNAAYGSNLRLLRYNLEVGDDAAYITLHWQSLRRMKVDYKFFVHLYDAESEALVAQVDTMPQDWTYPTTWWEADKVVSDETMLSFEDIPPGTYRLGVGVYNPLTGERLAITNQPGHFVVDEGRLFLLEEIVR